MIYGGAQLNAIGGSRAVGNGPMGQGNLLSGNGSSGISIDGSNTMSNTIVGNYIGTDAAGQAALGNSGDGVVILWGASWNNMKTILSAAMAAGVFQSIVPIPQTIQ